MLCIENMGSESDLASREAPPQPIEAKTKVVGAVWAEDTIQFFVALAILDQG